MDSRLVRAARSGNIEYLRQLAIQDPNLLLGVSPQGNTVLHIAVRLNKPDFASEVGALCPSLLSMENLEGDTPLHCAVRARYLPIVNHFIDCASPPILLRALLHKANYIGDTPLHEAIRNGYTGIVRQMVSIDPHLLISVNRAGESPLYLAAYNGFSDIIRTLMQSNSPIAHGGPDGQTALHATVIQKFSGIAEELLMKWPELNHIRDTTGRAAIHYATSLGSVEMVELLLGSDASVAYMGDNDGLSPIHIASSMGYVEVIQKLIYTCPDLGDLKDRKGRNALHVAVENVEGEVVKYILKTPELRELLNQPDDGGDTALHLAAAKQDLSIVDTLLLDGRLNKGALNHNKETALDTISFVDRLSLTKYEIMWTLGLAGVRHGAKKRSKIEEQQRMAKHIRSGASQNVALVAILIATITFAAGFTLPGGFESGQDQGGETSPPPLSTTMPGSKDQGQAILTGNSYFKVFLICDTIAMGSSATVAFLYMWNWTLYDDKDFLYREWLFVAFLMAMAFSTTNLAFDYGVRAVVASKSEGLANLITAILLIFGLLPTVSVVKLLWKIYSRGRKSFLKKFSDKIRLKLMQ